MSVVTKDTIQPSSGQALTIKDEGGTASITVATNGEATFAENIKVTDGKGIDFSAVSGSTSGSASAVLDDYEEGTWTPSLSVQADQIGTWDSTLTGTYTKIGRMVVCNLKITGSGMNINSADGYRVYTGVPFTITIAGAGSWITPNSNGPKGNTRTPDGGTTFVLLPSDLQSTTNTVNAVSTFFV